MSKIRVLVVDDAVVIRKILTDVLSEESDIEIVGVAANGKIALQKITQCNPDIITLDVEMPEMNGIDTVKKIRETHPKLPIIMFSTLTERGAETTLEALKAGASDYVTKPANVGSVTAAKERVKSDLVTRIRWLTRTGQSIKNEAHFSATPQTAAKIAQIKTKPIHSEHDPKIVVIGVSTGGPNALAEVLPALPADFPLPIVIVQHMPPLFTKMLADRLSAKCKLKAHEASQDMRITAGNIYIAPGDFHLTIDRDETGLKANLNKGPQENSCRPAVDPMFKSAVSIFGSELIAVILTGMGQDGLRGCEAVKAAGGKVIAQDEASSVVWGMPGYVVGAGLADTVLPLNQIAAEIVKCTKSKVNNRSSEHVGL